MNPLSRLILFAVIFVLFVALYLSHYEQPPVIEVVEVAETYKTVEYPFGTVGVTAFQDEATGEVYVVSCFQGEGDTVTDCWDKRFVKDEDDVDSTD